MIVSEKTMSLLYNDFKLYPEPEKIKEASEWYKNYTGMAYRGEDKKELVEIYTAFKKLG